MSIQAYLEQLRAQGVELSLHPNGTDLSFRAQKASLTDDIKASIRQRKPEIVAYLTRHIEGVERLGVRDQYDLSPGQHRLWLQEQFGGQTNNLAGAVHLRGALDRVRLEKALEAIVQRHCVFRTRFISTADGGAVQQILPATGFELTHENVSDSSNPLQTARDRFVRLAQEPFDLTAGELLRAVLFDLGSQEHVLVVNMPHIVADGVSLQTFDRELSQLYEGAQFEPLALRYVDFAHWSLQQTGHQADARYWRDQLEDAPLVTVDADTDAPSRKLFQANESALRLLDSRQTAKVRQFGAQRAATPFMTFMAAFGLALARHSGQNDLTLATAINHRPQAASAGIIGFFLNILALRIKVSGNPTFGDLIEQVRRTCLDGYAHQTLPFEQIVHELKPQREESRNPLARIAFAYGDTPWMPTHSLTLPGIEAQPLDIARGMLDFDMHLWVSEDKQGLTARLEYREDLYTAQAAESVLMRLRTVLQQLSADLERPLWQCDGLTDAQHDFVTASLALQPHPPYRSSSVLQAFSDFVNTQPDHVALQVGDQTMSWRALDELSDKLGAQLLALGVQPETCVGLYLPNSAAMVVAMLACGKSGAAYLPLEVDAPIDRLQFMVADSQAAVVLTSPTLAGKLTVNAPVLAFSLESLSGQAPQALPDWPQATPDRLAYVMYTSGSTGTPKGVRVPWRAIARLVLEPDYVQIGPDDRIAQLSNSAFDAFTFEIWGALANGATLVQFERDVLLNPIELKQQMADRGITIAFVTTALFNLIARDAVEPLARLRYLLFGGEQSDIELVRQYLKQPQPAHLVHVYGPTENTTFSTFYPVKAVAPLASHLPIGKPIRGTYAAIVSDDLALVAPGVTGELLLGGLGLAQGYLNRAELTQERFINDPRDPTARLYRTGDRVRLNAQGDIEFIGRTDNQIKLRGFRIELDEIQAKLVEIEGVTAAIVGLDQQASEARIVAYVQTHLSQAAVRDALEQRLPNYMLPALIVCMPALPINRNGKIDRQALQTMVASSNRQIRSARDAIDQALLDIWQSFLEGDVLSIDDNFFEIGGHSLLAARVTSKVSGHFGTKVDLRALFEHPTVARYADWLTTEHLHEPKALEAPIESVQRGSPLLLSSAQERLWFLDQMNPDSPAYNISYALRIEGDLDVSALERALQALLERHESLRTAFVSTQGQPYQVISEQLQLKLDMVDLQQLQGDQQAQALEQHRREQALKPFDTSKAPLIRPTLYHLQTKTWILAFCIHHIVADGWSLAVLRNDLGKLYEASLVGRPANLPALRAQYADYAHWDRSKRADLSDHLTYWREALAELPALHLPTDYPRPKVASFAGAAERFEIDAATVRRLKALGTECGATMFMTLLTAWAVLLERYSRQTDFAVGSPIAHRDHVDTENLIGFFVNTLVMRCEIEGEQSFRSHLQRMRETTLAAYAHQDMPFERLVQELDPERDPTANPLIQVIFALQNAPVSHQRLHNVDVSPLPYMVATTRFDLEMHLWQSEDSADEPDGLSGILVYNTALFAPQRMASLCRSFATLLQCASEQPDQALWHLNVVSPQDRQAALSHPKPIADYPRDANIAELFVQQAQTWPHKVALKLEDEQLTYRQLDEKSSQLAHAIIAKQLAPESPVVVKLESSFAFVITILGILKAGCCYVPVDINDPAARLQEMIEDLKPELVIDKATFDTMLSQSTQQPAQTLTVDTAATDLAYILFTSGSTGRPKGVRVPHRAVIRLVKNNHFHPFDSEQTWLQAASVAFDASTLEIWGALLNGSQLAMVPPGPSAFTRVAQTIRKHQVSSAWLTAGLFNTLVDNDLDAFATVKYLIAGGDVLSVRHVRALMRQFPAITMINGYGPTENTTFTCCHVLHAVPQTDLSIPIGQPISNTWVYIVDRALKPVVDGMPGELLAGGDGLARDYLNADELTQERFVTDPFDPSGQQRLYRTGDLVRRNIEGDIEFLGRIDTQIKLRGFRVETSEVEQVLRQHPEVQDVAIHVQGSGEFKKMIAYIVPVAPQPGAQAQDLSAAQVQDWESLFDGSLYQRLDGHDDPTFNTAGWKSSYNDQPIPAVQMKAWLDDFIATVERYDTKDILEIGCGTGMVLFRLAARCQSYAATDFSAQALAHIEHHLPNSHNVSLYQRDALDLSGFKAGQFDTVILNSVIQYFPDSTYLQEVIERCLPLIGDGGRLIIGDIRHYGLIDAFHASVTFAKSPPEMTVGQWRAHVSRSLLEEDELLVNPNFFTSLSHPRISEVRLRMQRPAFDNELSQFRYSAIIEVNTKRQNPPLQWFDATSLEAAAATITQKRPDAFGVRGVPNARLAQARALAELYNDTLGLREGSLRSIKHRLAQPTDIGLEPQDWIALGAKHGYHVEIGWADGNRHGAYDVIFVGQALAHDTVGVPARQSNDAPANMPLRGKLARALGPKLRQYCQTRLPDYMIASQFIMLPSLPLTKAGKVDRQALEVPERAVVSPKANIVAADNALERTIATIWGELLGVAQPGVTENFFDLGGHSMLMVQVCNRLKEQLGRDVPVLTMFEHPTIRSLAQALSQAPAAQTVATRSSTTNAERARKQRESIQRRAATVGRKP